MTYFVCPTCGNRIGTIDAAASAVCVGSLSVADSKRHPVRKMRREKAAA